MASPQSGQSWGTALRPSGDRHVGSGARGRASDRREIVIYCIADRLNEDTALRRLSEQGFVLQIGAGSPFPAAHSARCANPEHRDVRRAPASPPSARHRRAVRSCCTGARRTPAPTEVRAQSVLSSGCCRCSPWSTRGRQRARTRHTSSAPASLRKAVAREHLWTRMSAPNAQSSRSTDAAGKPLQRLLRVAHPRSSRPSRRTEPSRLAGSPAPIAQVAGRHRPTPAGLHLGPRAWSRARQRSGCLCSPGRPARPLAQ